MTYNQLQKKVSKLLEDTEDKMTNLIEEYNESIEDKKMRMRSIPLIFIMCLLH